MIRQDYILQLIQQLGEFIRRAADSRSITADGELNVHLEQLTAEVIGLPSELIMSLPADELVDLFQVSDRMVVEKCFVTAEIHRLKAENETNGERQTEYRERALFFYLTIEPNLTGKLADDVRQRLEELQAKSID
ncbi:MAG: hypothetical protein O3C43_02435 [Verrucomicrobia bacterium]|nr:hypothetical protein [Verrucomicrobiota bacterium]MDA1065342.1 hypothetical protein [Verrucomicrobiota bacterium]